MKWIDINNPGGCVARVSCSTGGAIAVDTSNERLRQELESGVTTQVGTERRTYTPSDRDTYLLALRGRYNSGSYWTSEIKEGFVAPPL
ncbi:hypothetical protein ACFL26_00575 [Patescibacteria group bacterium]